MKLELFYPCKPFGLNQAFGVNGAYYRAHGIMIDGHNGLDLQAKHGQPIYAAHDGVAYYQVDSSEGHGVILITNETFDYKGEQAYFKTIYWHMVDRTEEPKYTSPVYTYQQKNKQAPMPVKRGDLIGYADNSGFSGGDHLHFGLKPMRPGRPLNAWQDVTDVGIGNWRNIEQLNGYLGSINPMPYFNGVHAADGKAAGMTIEEYQEATKGRTNEPLAPDDAVAVLATKEALKGNKTLADRLWAIVAVIKAFLSK